MMEPTVVKWARRSVFFMGCLALLGSLVNPLVGLIQSALCFAFARGIRRRRAWAALAAVVMSSLFAVRTAVRLARRR